MGGGGWHPPRARAVRCDTSFPVKLRLSLFLTWSKPSHFSHLWNYAVKFRSNEAILLVVRKKNILCGRHYENTRNTKTESQMPSFRIVIGLPSKEILVKKKKWRYNRYWYPASVSRMEGLYLVKEQRDYDMHHQTRKCLNQNVCW